MGTTPFAQCTPPVALHDLRCLLALVGVTGAGRYRTHDLRRGHTEDLAERGSKLGEILKAGQWRCRTALQRPRVPHLPGRFHMPGRRRSWRTSTLLNWRRWPSRRTSTATPVMRMNRPVLNAPSGVLVGTVTYCSARNVACVQWVCNFVLVSTHTSPDCGHWVCLTLCIMCRQLGRALCVCALACHAGPSGLAAAHGVLHPLRPDVSGGCATGTDIKL